MRGYGWDEFDAHHGGVQSIHDVANKVDITTSFVKVPGGDRGGSWAARIKGELRPDAPADMQILIFLYFAQEGGGQLYVDTQGTEFGFDDDVAFRGTSPSLGRYEIAVTKGRGEHPSMDHEHTIDKRHGDTTLVDSISLPDDLVWQAKQVVFRQLQEALVGIKDEIDADNPPPAWQIYQLGNNPGSGNVHVVQKTFQGPFEFDVIFSSESAGEPLTSSTMTSRISETSKSFDDRFARVFDLKAPFSAKKYQAFAKSMLSNLLGGVGYFYGNQVVDRSQAPEYDEDDERFWIGAAEARARNQQALEGPYELISSVPSRPFFPRGFLWDEGFHLLLISDWDMDVALEIMQSWYNTMDYDGWIPREQILGAEARSKVPEEFQVQYPHYANPPTLCLVLEQYLDRVGELTGSDERRAWVPYDAHVDDKKAARDFLQQLYPKLRRQYDWFRKTQRGDVKSYGRDAFSTKEAYRWRGRSETHVLPSGLDDYPRPQPPSPSELHVDLISWVGLMTKTLLRTAEALDLLEEAAELKKNLHALRQNVEDLHWSESEGCYCDATVDDFEEHKLVCHKGYLSLFPFLVGLMDRDDPKLGKILDLIGDEQHLFSKHGIRSLSKQDPNYGTNEDYWRSPVWIPINYLIASQLHVSLIVFSPPSLQLLLSIGPKADSLTSGPCDP